VWTWRRGMWNGGLLTPAGRFLRCLDETSGSNIDEALDRCRLRVHDRCAGWLRALQPIGSGRARRGRHADDCDERPVSERARSDHPCLEGLDRLPAVGVVGVAVRRL